MYAFIRKLCVLLIALHFIGLQVGCGTVVNVGDPAKPPSYGDQSLSDDRKFGGPATFDRAWASNDDKVIFGGVINDVSLFSNSRLWMFWIPALVDIPLSVAGDVVTLPFTVYWTVSTRPLHREVELGRIEVVRDKLKRGAKIDKKDVNGRTPLMLSALFGRHEIFRVLVQNGADVVKSDPYGSTALMMAQKDVSEDRSDMTETLLEHGARANKVDEDGNTALIYAAIFCQFESVRVLLEHGADVDIKNDDGYTALDYARRRTQRPKCSKIIKLIEKHGA